jgi:uncharacterized membrane protein
MEKLRALVQDVVESLWFLPALLTLAGGATAVLLIRYDDEILGGLDAGDVWWLFGGGAEGAQGVLSAIAGSIITVTGVVFSVTIIALQLASSQFTPRVLRQFMAARSNQLVLGVFIATFTYALLVLRTVRTGDAGDEFVPAVAVTGAVLLALTSIGFLIYFINHAGRSMQAAVIIDSATADAMRALRRLYPTSVEHGEAPRGAKDAAAEDTAAEGAALEGAAAEGAAAELARTEAEPCRITARRSGYVQAIDRRSLRRVASENGLLVRVELEIGAYLLPGQVVMSVWPADAVRPGPAAKLRDALVLGMERTPHQDLKHGIIELIDIAVKALSPSINDPTTAVNAVHRLAEVLLQLAWSARGDDVECDDDGRPLVILRRPSLTDAVALAFNQIRHYGVANPTIAVTLLETLGELAALSPRSARPPFLEQLQHVQLGARRVIEDAGDRARVERAAAAALARAAGPPPAGRPTD